MARDRDGDRKGEKGWRKEESEERLPQLPPFVIGELVHQVSYIVKAYPKTRVNLDLQFISELSHSTHILSSHGVMYEHRNQGLLDLSRALNSGIK